MRQLFEYVSKQDVKVIVPEYSLKATPDQLGKKVSDLVKDLAEGEVKDAVVKAIDNWYQQNSTRRNISARTYISTFLFINDKKDKLLNEVINEIERIGVSGGDVNEFDFIDDYPSWSLAGRKCGVAEIDFFASTLKQFKEGNYKYNISKLDVGAGFISNSHGNGYNGLPVDDMNVIRRKLYDCMIDTKCTVLQYSNPRGDSKYASSVMPEFRVVLSAVYNKSKLKSLLNELKSDRRLQVFADKMDVVSKGIRDYYASKRPGEYVGD